MRVIIEDEYLARIYSFDNNVIRKPKFNKEIERGFIKRVIQIEQAQNTNDLRVVKSLHFEKLSGNLDGKHSIRINQAYRIIFRIEKDGNNNRAEIICIEEVNNHYS
ncbi:MAG: type II toxin-antitoxin system RelE/ParE family toxin [Mucilaginibacter sp.]|uniref:type II toxin-antitoxin system RelE/ParE family toxin n=1 Tax=Mucilaginibacter sp. TaxID=1882438 RepID=UPI0034E5ECA2